MGGEVSTPTKILGDWLARVDNTVYQAPSDGFVHGVGVIDNLATGYTTGVNPPVTMRMTSGPHNTVRFGVTFAVRKNDYWEVTGCGIVWWIPLEP